MVKKDRSSLLREPSGKTALALASSSTESGRRALMTKAGTHDGLGASIETVGHGGFEGLDGDEANQSQAQVDDEGQGQDLVKLQLFHTSFPNISGVFTTTSVYVSTWAQIKLFLHGVALGPCAEPGHSDWRALRCG